MHEYGNECKIYTEYATEPDIFPINKLRETPHKLSQVQKLAQDKSEGEEKFQTKTLSETNW